MGVGLSRRILWAVCVAVVFVVAVGVGMHHPAMAMRVLVALGDVQPNADGHERSGGKELDRQWLLEGNDRGRRADERRGRKIRPGASRAEMAQRDDE
jgi:hypothetical protein